MRKRKSPVAREFAAFEGGRYRLLKWKGGGGAAVGGCTSLTVAVLDSPLDGSDHQIPFAALLVPRGKEKEWVFCTEAGRWQLLFSAHAGRLVVLIRDRETLPSEQSEGGEQPLQQKAKDFAIEASEVSQLSDNKALIVKFDRGGYPHEAEKGYRVTGRTGRHLMKHEFKEQRCRSAEKLADTEVQNEKERDGRGGGRIDGLENDEEDEVLKKDLNSFILSLAPAKFFAAWPAAVPFISYEDNVVNRIIVEEAFSHLTGRVLVEDVELLEETDTTGGAHTTKVLRRRLRFERMPNLIQTEVPIVILNKGGQPAPDPCILKGRLDVMNFDVRVDHSMLVHKYLAPLVAGLVLAAPGLEMCLLSGKKVRTLSIGVGGGALPMFLRTRLGFIVEAVDLDEVVLGLARRHFGLVEDDYLRVKAADGVKVVTDIANQAIECNFVDADLAYEFRRLAKVSEELCHDSSTISSSNISQSCNKVDCNRGSDSRMNVIMVDVDAGDACLGLSSPPMAFLSKLFLLAARIALQDGGMLAMNVLSYGTKPYKHALNALRQVFAGLYELKVGDGENHVVFAFPFKIVEIDLESSVALAVKQVIDERLIYQIIEVDE